MARARNDDQEVDHTSLRAAGDVVQEVAGRLDDLAGQTFAGAGRHPVSDVMEPSAEFDAEYADLLRMMPQAYTSIVEHLGRVADGIIEHSDNHRRAEQANKAIIEDV
ncbi:hypothetical protein FE391_07505 [Nonomuraea sp. KC401]|uniref:hypothetical protein n=1 Tax=unclassified Nonomuraea TaxID=2593643 RepID=UPI0010FF4D77|nr:MULTISPECIES: hypothetical protein [unclassified Nonomuraea]NBE93093.1 hypothetical protein [Nonomuraea sp. K271]TLF80349.1 hypothetical protein FE391_07505 [Nonomuraea sp. KC401]